MHVRQNDKVRIRIGNLTMTNHPMHLHGHEFVVDRHRRRPDAEEHALARGDDRRRGRPDAADRVHRRRRRRLGVPLPQEPPHDERDGPRRADDDRRRSSRRGAADHEADSRLHGDGRARHGRHGRDGDAAARQHAADDDRRGSVRLGRDGRHVHRGQGAARPEARRLQRSGLVQATRRHAGLRVDRARWPSRRASRPRARLRCGRKTCRPRRSRCRCASRRAMPGIDSRQPERKLR